MSRAVKCAGTRPLFVRDVSKCYILTHFLLPRNHITISAMRLLNTIIVLLLSAKSTLSQKKPCASKGYSCSAIVDASTITQFFKNAGMSVPKGQVGIDCNHLSSSLLTHSIKVIPSPRPPVLTWEHVVRVSCFPYHRCRCTS